MNGIYTANCGNKNSPCEFTIQLKRPNIVFIPDEITEMNHILESIKFDMSKSFVNKKFQTKTFKHTDDKSGKSIVTMYYIRLNDGYIDISYTNWSEKVKWTDHVAVSVSTNEVYDWTENNYGAN